LKAFNAGIVDQFRANGGKAGGQHQGANLLLLTTTGAKSGQPRLVPLAYAAPLIVSEGLPFVRAERLLHQGQRGFLLVFEMADQNVTTYIMLTSGRSMTVFVVVSHSCSVW
jgi:F420H(2)-dependent quinone reductase